MAVSGLFLVSYGCLRSGTEFFREPDAHMGFILADSLTAGQMLSMPMMLIGLILLTLAYKQTKK